MKPWLDRPTEIAHLLNPAFCGTVLSASVSGYATRHTDGMPFPLTFMVLPIILHRSTRQALPPNTRTSLPAWLHRHSSSRVLFHERLASLKPFTREAMLFALLHHWLVLSPDGSLGVTMTQSQMRRLLARLDGEARECGMRALFLGKWFAAASSPETVMTAWGVRP